MLPGRAAPRSRASRAALLTMSTPTAMVTHPCRSPWAYVKHPLPPTRRAQRRCAALHAIWGQSADFLGAQRGFWYTFLAIPAAWAVYYASRDNADNSKNFVSRSIDKYAEAQDKLARMNDLHVRMIEQAGEDRVLFMNAKPQEYVDMKFPEYVLPATKLLPTARISILEIRGACARG